MPTITTAPDSGPPAAYQTFVQSVLSALNRIPTPIAIIGPDGRFGLVNAAFAALFGRPADRFAGTTIEAVFGTDGICTPSPPALQRILAGEAVQYEGWWTFPAAGRRYIALVRTIVHDAAGLAGGSVLTITDLTEPHHREELLMAAQRTAAAAAQAAQRAERLLRDAIGRFPHGFALFDADDRLVLWNDQFVRMFFADDPVFVAAGVSFEALAQRFEALGGYCRTTAAAMVPMSLEERIAQHQEPKSSFLERLADGRWIRTDERRTEDGVTIAFYLDVTELKDRESGLRDAMKQFAASSQAKNRLLSLISDELRTPLNAIIGFSDILLVSDLNDQDKGYAETILSAGHALLDKVDRIITFTRMDGYEVEPQPEEFSVRSFVEAKLKKYASEAGRRGLDLFGLVASDTPDLVAGDLGRIRLVVKGLLTNALKFTGAGHVALEVAMADRHSEVAVIRFDVRDTGIGVAPGMREAIFEAFTQAEEPLTRRFSGLGLGLALCRKAARLLGGDVVLQECSDGGSLFRFTVPVRTIAPAQYTGTGRMALVVCRDPVLRALVQRQLECWGDTVAAVSTVADADGCIRQHGPPDYVLVRAESNGAVSAAVSCLPAFSGNPVVLGLQLPGRSIGLEPAAAGRIDGWIATPILSASLDRLLAAARAEAGSAPP